MPPAPPLPARFTPLSASLEDRPEQHGQLAVHGHALAQQIEGVARPEPHNIREAGLVCVFSIVSTISKLRGGDCLDLLGAPRRRSTTTILKGVGLPYETTSGTTIRPATSFLPDGTCKFAHLRQVGLGQGARE